MTADATWLLRLDTEGDGPRLAVKDCIDVAGTPTTVGCPAVMDTATPADLDAPVVETARRQGARIVGKTNLVELCRHIDGINPWTGTPRNPIDPERVPGGSSSGSAVAVALGEADVAYGTDTGGSVRVPAACCGIAGLKTTAGRIPTQGVYEFSRTLDTVGPIARDVAGLVLGMRLMEPGFAGASVEPSATGDTQTHDEPTRHKLVHDDAVGGGQLSAARLRFANVDPAIDAAIDRALAAAGVVTTDVVLPEWETWIKAANEIMTAEGYWVHRHLLDRPDRLEERDVRDIRAGRELAPARVAERRRTGLAVRRELGALLARHQFLVLPTLRDVPPRIGERSPMTYLTVPLNLAGLPAVSLPVPRSGGAYPASLQLVGGWFEEERLLSAAAVVEAAATGVTGEGS